MKRSAAFLFAVFLLGRGPLLAADAPLRRVEIQDASSDGVGKELVAKIKDGIRRSPSLVEGESGARVLLVINSFDPDAGKETQGARSIYSVVWALRGEDDDRPPQYLATTLGVCRRERTDNIAEAILADTGAAISYGSP